MTTGAAARESAGSGARRARGANPGMALTRHEQAEGVPGGIEAHPHVVLRLVLGDDGPRCHGAGAGRVEVVDLDVEVRHHQLLARPSRPRRPHVGGLGLEREAGASARWCSQRHPVRLVRAHRPPEQPLVEAGELPGVGGVEHGGGQIHPRCRPGHGGHHHRRVVSAQFPATARAERARIPKFRRAQSQVRPSRESQGRWVVEHVPWVGQSGGEPVIGRSAGARNGARRGAGQWLPCRTSRCRTGP